MKQNNIDLIDKIVWYIPIKKLRNYVREILTYFFTMKDQLDNLVKETYSNYSSVDVYWWEYPIIKEFRSMIEKDNSFLEKYNNLLLNLDEDSKRLVINILHKLSNYDKIEDKIYFTKDEVTSINKSIYEHESKIIKINNNCYLYDNYMLPVKRFGMDIFYDKYGIDKLSQYTIEAIKNKDIIDAGAYIGDTAILLSDYTDKNVYSFEPFSVNYNVMLQTIEMNKKNNIIPVLAALGSNESEISIFSNGELDSSSKITSQYSSYNSKEEKVKMITLDKFVEENNINVGLIKTDLEGFEQEFLNGAINTIKKYKPVLLLSIYHNYNDFFNIKPFIEKLKLGYKFKIIKTNTKYSVVTSLLIAETRPDQTRPDQTRPDQTRPNIHICSDYIYIYINRKKEKIQPMLQYKIAA